MCTRSLYCGFHYTISFLKRVFFCVLQKCSLKYPSINTIFLFPPCSNGVFMYFSAYIGYVVCQEGPPLYTNSFNAIPSYVVNVCCYKRSKNTIYLNADAGKYNKQGDQNSNIGNECYGNWAINQVKNKLSYMKVQTWWLTIAFVFPMLISLRHFCSIIQSTLTITFSHMYPSQYTILTVRVQICFNVSDHFGMIDHLR